jgi:hypothetical protein
MLSVIAGVVMVVGGLLVLEGYRGWMLGVAGAAVGAFVVSDSVWSGRRSD